MKKSFKTADNPLTRFISEDDSDIVMVDTHLVNTGEPFISLFKIDNDVYDSIKESMEDKGFDPSQPLIIWKEENVLLDGHTRLRAAQACGIQEVPVIKKSFDSQEESITYMMQLQFNRRNIQDCDSIILKIAYDVLSHYEKGKGLSKHELLIEKLNNLSISRAKKIATVVERAAPEELELVFSEQLSINALYNQVKKPRPADQVVDEFPLLIDDSMNELIEVGAGKKKDKDKSKEKPDYRKSDKKVAKTDKNPFPNNEELNPYSDDLTNSETEINYDEITGNMSLSYSDNDQQILLLTVHLPDQEFLKRLQKFVKDYSHNWRNLCLKPNTNA